MKKSNQHPTLGNIVKTIKDGNTKVLICDDYFAKTPEEIETVLTDYHTAGWRIVENLIQAGEEV